MKTVGEEICEQMIEEHGIEINLSPGPQREHLAMLIDRVVDRTRENVKKLAEYLMEEL
jgi:hypothetical protein